MSCVYSITCLINNKVYIGFTHQSFRLRCQMHKASLKAKQGVNKELQEDWLKYGVENFKFEIVEKTKDEKREAYWIYTLNNLYNVRVGYSWNGKENVPMYGKKHSQETKNKWKRKGINNPNAKLDLEKALLIKEKIKENTEETWKDKELRIAKEFKISITTVSRIKLGTHHLSNKLGGKYFEW